MRHYETGLCSRIITNFSVRQSKTNIIFLVCSSKALISSCSCSARSDVTNNFSYYFDVLSIHEKSIISHLQYILIIESRKESKTTSICARIERAQRVIAIDWYDSKVSTA